MSGYATASRVKLFLSVILLGYRQVRYRARAARYSFVLLTAVIIFASDAESVGG